MQNSSEYFSMVRAIGLIALLFYAITASFHRLHPLPAQGCGKFGVKDYQQT
jgi:hypothetical protein